MCIYFCGRWCARLAHLTSISSSTWKTSSHGSVTSALSLYRRGQQISAMPQVGTNIFKNKSSVCNHWDWRTILLLRLKFSSISPRNNFKNFWSKYEFKCVHFSVFEKVWHIPTLILRWPGSKQCLFNEQIPRCLPFQEAEENPCSSERGSCSTPITHNNEF